MTRAVVAELVRPERRFQIVTKGTVVRRDLDLIAGYERAAVTISLCSVDEEALRRVDPKAPSAVERLETMQILLDAGVPVTISVSPFIPGITDAEAIVDRVPERGLVVFAPLNVSTSLAHTAYGERFEQRSVPELLAPGEGQLDVPHWIRCGTNYPPSVRGHADRVRRWVRDGMMRRCPRTARAFPR